jgi:CRP-like cAMP-binding protein
VVNQTVLEHLIHSGIMPAHSKEEVFLSRRERRTLDSSLEEDLHQLLTRSQLFRELSAGEFKGLFQEMRKRTLEEGEVVYQQQEEGDSMFVCLEGLLSSSVNFEGERGVKVQTIRAGQYFGEKAVLGDSSRNTTITTDTEVLLYEISREAFESVLNQHKGLRDQLQASVDKTGEAVNKKVKQAIEERAVQPVARKKTAMQKVAQAFFPGMFDDDEEPEKKGGANDR